MNGTPLSIGLPADLTLSSKRLLVPVTVVSRGVQGKGSQAPGVSRGFANIRRRRGARRDQRSCVWKRCRRGRNVQPPERFDGLAFLLGLGASRPCLWRNNFRLVRVNGMLRMHCCDSIRRLGYA